MPHDFIKQARTALGKTLIIIGAIGAGTAALAVLDLCIRADEHSLSPLTLPTFGIQQFFIVNQATLGPLIFSGVAFLRDWKIKPLILLLSFCVGLIPFVWYFDFIRVEFGTLFSETHPFNYGAVFLLLLATLTSFGFIIAFAVLRYRSRRNSKDREGHP